MPLFKSFEDYVKGCARHENADIIQNASISHAKIIVDQLFESAIRHGENIRMASGRLLPEFYSDIIDKAKKVLSQRIRISVVVLDSTEDDLRDNKLYSVVVNDPHGEVLTSRGSMTGEQVHYVLVGEKRYRVEIDDKTKEAIASFNDPRIGGLLADAHKRYTQMLQGAH